MASGIESVVGPSGEELMNDLKVKLYDLCLQEKPGNVFRQEDILRYQVIPEDNILLMLQVCQSLCDDKFFKLIRDGSALSWSCRSREDAAKYRSLTLEQEMVYLLIDEAGKDGLWTRTIKTRSGMHETAMRSVLKTLEAKHYISDMKHVEHPSHKMYIKFNLTPSEKATGGPWYTDGEMDLEFIHSLSEVLHKRILDKSFHNRRTVKPNKARKILKSSAKKTGPQSSAEEARALRDATLNPIIKLEPNGVQTLKRRREERELDHLVPLPPGYQGYPTLNELTSYILDVGITETVLTKEDISQLLDMLCFDKKIEKIISGPEGIAYKAFRRSAREMEDGPDNGLTEVPCGRCPIIDLCEEGGPVGPSNCEYFKAWLDT